jgi:hypothetical protein
LGALKWRLGYQSNEDHFISTQKARNPEASKWRLGYQSNEDHFISTQKARNPEASKCKIIVSQPASSYYC